MAGNPVYHPFPTKRGELIAYTSMIAKLGLEKMAELQDQLRVAYKDGEDDGVIHLPQPE